MTNRLTPKELRSKRIELGWTPQQLANKCGLPITQILAYESGEVPIDCDDLLLNALQSHESDK